MSDATPTTTDPADDKGDRPLAEDHRENPAAPPAIACAGRVQEAGGGVCGGL
jgi:hypothetical protein